MLSVKCERANQTVDKNGDARAVTLVISKSLESYQHAGLHRLKRQGVPEFLFDSIQLFL